MPVGPQPSITLLGDQNQIVGDVGSTGIQVDHRHLVEGENFVGDNLSLMGHDT